MYDTLCVGPGWFGRSQQEQPEEQEQQQRVSGVGRPRLSLRLRKTLWVAENPQGLAVNASPPEMGNAT
jgi:hypothetical protein